MRLSFLVELQAAVGIAQPPGGESHELAIGLYCLGFLQRFLEVRSGRAIGALPMGRHPFVNVAFPFGLTCKRRESGREQHDQCETHFVFTGARWRLSNSYWGDGAA